MLDWNIQNNNGEVRFSTDGGNSVFRMDEPEYGRFEFETASRLKVVSLFAQFGDHSEALTLRGRRKHHVSETGEELSLDTENPVPFGTEPQTDRTFRFNGNDLTVQTSFMLRHSFKMESISAGGLVFSGPVSTVEITPVPATPGAVPAPQKCKAADTADGAVIFDDACPPLRFAVITEQGDSLTFELGETIWRWINASRISGSSRYTITRQDGTFRFDWQLYTFVPETEDALPPDGRDWRLHFSLISREKSQEQTTDTPYKAVFDASAQKWQSAALSTGSGAVCFSSAPALNALKKWVRQQFADAQEGDVFAVINVPEHVCGSAAHMDRAKLKTLLHWDRPALTEFARWANRQLGRYGARLVIQ